LKAGEDKVDLREVKNELLEGQVGLMKRLFDKIYGFMGSLLENTHKNELFKDEFYAREKKA